MFNFLNPFSSNNYTPLSNALVKAYNQHRPMGAKQYLCYAPFKNIYFGHYGRAVACCYNRTHVLGEYPAQSIKEIWFGKQAEKLREYIKHNDLALGCFGCKQHIVSGNYDGSKSKQYDQHTLNKNKYPSVMEFELSNVCNLECEMCNGNFSSLIRAKRENLPPLHIPYDNKFVDQLEEFIPYLDEVKFYGGEPFLIDIYYEIWDRIIKINPNVRISVQTNGTTLNSRLKDLMEKIDFHINVSFDSLQKEAYESIRKNANYERVLENIAYFKDYCKRKNTFFGISVCAMQQNWRELPDFINYCNNMDVPVYFHTVSFPLSCSIRAMVASEIDEIKAYLERFDFAEDTPTQKKNKVHYFDFIKQIENWQYQTEKRTSVKRVRNMAELKEVVAKYINSDDTVDKGVRDKKVERIVSRITELEGKINMDGLGSAFERVDMNDPEILRSIVFYVDKLPMPALIAMAKSNQVLNGRDKDR